MSGRKGPVRVGELVEGVLDHVGAAEQVRRQSVLESWDEAVGERIADVTRPVSVDEGVLFVEVRSSAWMNELDLMKQSILERINENRGRGRIEKLRFLLAEQG